MPISRIHFGPISAARAFRALRRAIRFILLTPEWSRIDRITLRSLFPPRHNPRRREKSTNSIAHCYRYEDSEPEASDVSDEGEEEEGDEDDEEEEEEEEEAEAEGAFHLLSTVPIHFLTVLYTPAPPKAKKRKTAPTVEDEEDVEENGANGDDAEGQEEEEEEEEEADDTAKTSGPAAAAAKAKGGDIPKESDLPEVDAEE